MTDEQQQVAAAEWAKGLNALMLEAPLSVVRDIRQRGDAMAAEAVQRQAARYAPLVEAMRELKALPLLRGASGDGRSFTMTFPDTGVLERIDAALAELGEQDQ